MLSVGIKVCINYDVAPNAPGVQLRLVSEFSEAVATGFLSEAGGEGWTVTNEPVIEMKEADPTTEGSEPYEVKSGLLVAEWEGEVPCQVESEGELKLLNTAPGLFAITLMETTEEIQKEVLEGETPPEPEVVPKMVPLDFAYIDCSAFLVRAGSLKGNTQTGPEGVSVEITVTSEEPLRPTDDIVPLEPLILDVDSLSNYPRQAGEDTADRLNTTYVCGEIPFGKEDTRFIFVRAQRDLPEPPRIAEEGEEEDGAEGGIDADGGEDVAEDIETNLADTRVSVNDVNDGDSDAGENDEPAVVLGLQSCYLSGLASIDQTREQFNSTTFVLEIHHDEVSKRAFHARNVAAYNTALREEENGAAAESNGDDDDAVVSKLVGPDKLLVQAIKRAVLGSGHVRPHGGARFRLEQLLRGSEDLLEEFARRRALLTQTQVAEEFADQGGAVAVREDMAVEVKLRKPSKPVKWSRPSDISLRSALRRVEAEAQSRLDGTLAAGGGATATVVMGNGKTTKMYDPPRHEKFKDERTALVLSAELRRKLAHPKETPLVTAEVEERRRATRIASDFGRTADFGELDGELVHRLSVTPFTRMVFVFKYDDDETLMKINDVLVEVNSRALPNIQGTLRSYSLTEDEEAETENAQLDLLTGFAMIDDEKRIIVVEGLAGPGQGMQQLFADLPRVKPNDNSLKILCNPEVLFPRREYTPFGPDLKRIRVRDKLKKLARKPEIYNRYQVEEVCFQAVDSVMALRRAVDLKQTKDMNMYPSAESLNKLELLYGEAISRVDLDGSIIEEKRVRGLRGKVAGKKREDLVNVARRESERVPGANDETPLRNVTSLASSTVTNPRLLPTDSRNPEFEEYLKTRGDHHKDFLGENRLLRMQAWEQALRRRAKRDADDEAYRAKILGPTAAENGGKIYCYATQALNFKVLAFSELRERLSKFKSSTFTFSQDFVSQTVCIVDEEVDKKKIESEKKGHWLTSKGFRYPLPKQPIDYVKHPQKPSQFRIDALSEPFVETSVSAGIAPDKRTAAQLLLEQGYTTRIKGGNDFGKLKWPSYEREFELQRVGDRQKLPRGTMKEGVQGDQDPQFFRSVFVGGDDAAAQDAADALAEKEAWRSKVVVDADNLTMKVGGFKIRDKPLQTERTRDILQDPPKRRELKHLRNRKGHDGRDLSLCAPVPYTIINVGEFVENASSKALQRGSDRTKFVTSTHEKSGKDFVRFINMNDRLPKSQRLIHRRSIPWQDRATAPECVGPKWEPA